MYVWLELQLLAPGRNNCSIVCCNIAVNLIIAHYLDSGSSLLLEKHILRLHITVNDLVAVESVEALQKAVGELADQLQREALELVLLYQLVQIDG